MVPAPVTVFWYRSKAGIFAVVPGVQAFIYYHHGHYVRLEKQTGLRPKSLICAHRLLPHAIVITPPTIRPGSVHAPEQSLAPYHTPSLPHPLQSGRGLLILSTMSTVSTPPCYDTPSLPRPLAAGFPCVMLITGHRGYIR